MEYFIMGLMASLGFFLISFGIVLLVTEVLF